MSVTINIVNQPLGNDQIPAGEVCRKVSRMMSNPKHIAVWAMVSMAEASIDMADVNTTIVDVELELTAGNIRERAKDFVEDMLQELRDDVHAAIQDLEFCKALVQGIKFQRSSQGKMLVEDIDVDLSFDFNNTRR